MQLLDQNPADVFPSHKKTTFIEDTLPSSNAKTKRFESNWFTSSVYKEKVGIYSKFSQIFMHILSNSFDLFNYLYLKAKQSQEDEDFSKEYHFIYATKQIIDSSFNQINETLSIYDFRKSILLQDVTGLNYKLLSKLTSIVSELEDFLQTNNHEYEYLKKNQENQDKTLKNWFLVYSYIFKHFIETINFNLRLFDPKSNITQKLKKSSQFIIILKMLMEEMSQIFLKNQGKSLITLISNYKIQEINDLESINERLGIERIKSSSPLSAFQDFSFILSPNNLPFIESAKDKEFMCNVSNKYKKIYLFRFSEICKGDDTKKNFSIELPDYFKPKCEYKYIHYFKPFSKFLLMFDVGLIQKNINLDNGNYMKIPLNIPFDLAYESKSIITPDGEIYLSSGKFNEKGLFYPDDSFFLLDYEKLTLVPQAKMPVAKKFHAIVYLKKCIFIIGGKTKEKKCSGECEKYDIFTKKWKKITPLNEPVIYPSATAFGENYIYKFGGINQYDFLDKTIERYDINSNSWWIVRWADNESENKLSNLSLLYQSLACQINEKQIVIFGGRNINGFKVDSMMVFDVNDEEKSNLSKTRLFGTIEDSVDDKRNILSFAGDYHESSQMIYNNSIYVLRKDCVG